MLCTRFVLGFNSCSVVLLPDCSADVHCGRDLTYVMVCLHAVPMSRFRVSNDNFTVIFSVQKKGLEGQFLRFKYYKIKRKHDTPGVASGPQFEPFMHYHHI